MKRLIVVPAVAICCAVSGATPAIAATKNCKTGTEAKTIVVTNMKCKKGRKVLRRYFHGVKHPFGFTCKQEQFEGGASTRCHKGTHIVEQQIAD
ncbi:MAG: hypothetical protein QOI80_1531 [Solirubrobacteraceae bacterium]|jgi:hypothetical protein|nr:hypothetical protein [Solirubrobacteraceae bacterium]